MLPHRHSTAVKKTTISNYPNNKKKYVICGRANKCINKILHHV